MSKCVEKIAKITESFRRHSVEGWVYILKDYMLAYWLRPTEPKPKA